MFKKEYIIQKVVLFFAIISILIYAGTFLPEKKGLSAYEAKNFTIANSNETLGDSPYHWYYDTKTLEQEFSNLDYFPKISKVLSMTSDCWKNSTTRTNTSIASYSNNDWKTKQYYDDLIKLDRSKVYDFSSVSSKCIATRNAPLYFYLLHFFSSLFDGVGMFQVAFFLNAITVFTMAFILFTIGKKYLKSGWTGFIAAIGFSLTMGCFSALHYATPYLLSSLFLLLFLCIAFSIIAKNKITVLLVQGIILINMFGNLSNYTYTLFAFLVSIIVILALLCYKRYIDALKFVIFSLLSLVASFLLNPAILLHISTYIIGYNKTAGNLFMSGELANVLSDNLSLINEQTFGSAALFIGVTLLVLIIFSAYLKKGTFRAVYESWYFRLLDRKIADTLLIIIGVLYFLVICLFNPKEPYYALISTLPVFSLIFAYLLYQIGMALLHTSKNSGVFCLFIIGILSIYTTKTTDMPWLYSAQEPNINFATTFQKDYCIFLSSATMDASEHLLELNKFDNSIVLNRNTVNFLKHDKTFQSLDRVILYISNEDFVENLTDHIAELGHFELSNEMYNYYNEKGTHIYVYQLQHLNI